MWFKSSSTTIKNMHTNQHKVALCRPYVNSTFNKKAYIWDGLRGLIGYVVYPTDLIFRTRNKFWWNPDGCLRLPVALACSRRSDHSVIHMVLMPSSEQSNDRRNQPFKTGNKAIVSSTYSLTHSRHYTSSTVAFCGMIGSTRVLIKWHGCRKMSMGIFSNSDISCLI